MEQPQIEIPPYRAHDGDEYPRPRNASADHVPVWHRFLDIDGQTRAEHISHWIVDPGPMGYLNRTDPIDETGEYVGNEQAQCFNCGTPVILVNGTFYRRDGSVLLMRIQDDPEWDEPHR